MRIARVRDRRSGEVVLVNAARDGSKGRRLRVAVTGYEQEHRLEALLRLGPLQEVLVEEPGNQIDLGLEELEWLPPVEDPHLIVCAGQNFAFHTDESTDVSAPTRPSAFLRVPRTLNGHRSRLPYPEGTCQLDYEVEVAAVLATDAVDIVAEDSLSRLAGFCLANDISARDIQFEEARAGSMVIGKNLPGSLPLGPWLMTPDELPPVDQIEIALTVNGQEMQRDCLGAMSFRFPELISYWSLLGLRAGDLVLSGTPAGVGIFRQPRGEHLLRAGDTVMCSSPQLGELEITIDPPVANDQAIRKENSS